MEDGSPFGLSILAVALYLRFVHAVSYRRLTRLLLHLFALAISEGALDVILARRRFALKESTRIEYRRRLERDLDAILALIPTNRHGKRLRKRYLAVRDHLFTFLTHPEVPPDNNGSERELRPMAMYRKVTGGFRSDWGADLCAAVKSVIGTASRRGVDAYQAILAVLSGRTVLQAG